MLNLDRKGIAPVVFVVLAVTIAGGTAGAPVAVDTMDVKPDHPLYTLERAGEGIKSTFMGGQSWELDRADERKREFLAMLNKGKGEKYRDLVHEIMNHLDQCAKYCKDNKMLRKACKAYMKHREVLENVKEKAPEIARPAIELAIERSSRNFFKLEHISENEEVLAKAKELREEIREKLDEIRDEIKKETKQVKKRIRKGENACLPAQSIAQSWRIEHGKELLVEAKSMIEENIEGYEKLIEEAEDFLEEASEESINKEGLQRVIQASNKHLKLLENVYWKVPVVARSGIGLAIERSRCHVQGLEEILENEKILEKWKELRKRTRKRLGSLRENFRPKYQKIREEIRKTQRFEENLTESWKKWLSEEYMPAISLENLRGKRKMLMPRKETMRPLCRHMGTWSCLVSGRIEDGKLTATVEKETEISFGEMGKYEVKISGVMEGQIAEDRIEGNVEGSFDSSLETSSEGTEVEITFDGTWSGTIDGTVSNGIVEAGFDGVSEVNVSGNYETFAGEFEWSRIISCELNGKLTGTITDGTFNGTLYVSAEVVLF